MNFKKITFFNQWRNGDCFINKEYVREIAERFSPLGIELWYAHNNHKNIVADLPVKFVTMYDIPSMNTFMPMGLDTVSKTMYINTWVGCWIGKHMGEKDHANFFILNDMWKNVYQDLNMRMRGGYIEYLPEIRFDSFDLTEAEEYLNRIGNKQLIFFSNGKQQSEQSSMGDMSKIIRNLTERFKDIEFYATDPVGFEASNLTVCTHDSGFLNQLSHISKRANIIVGKNSGPFTYAHIKENINNPEKTFVCFSHKMKDCLLGEGEYLCNSYFNDTTDDDAATKIIEHIVLNPSYEYTPKPTKFYSI